MGVRLQRWLVDEVLPQIRRTGRYESLSGESRRASSGTFIPHSDDRLRSDAITRLAEKLLRSNQIDTHGYGELLRQAGELLGVHVTLCDTNRERDPAAALRAVRSWAEANAKRFEGVGQRPRRPLGRWTPGGKWTEIAFIPGELRTFLRSDGFDPEPILRAWSLHGWVRCEPGRTTARRRIQGKTVPCIVLSRYGIEQALDEAADER